MSPSAPWVTRRCPAKLNLFLELLGKRADGFHELDTVMVAIDVCDLLSVKHRSQPEIRLSLDWLPSRAELESQLWGAPDADSFFDIPDDHRNLVHRAIEAIAQHDRISGGFEVRLKKRIPPGAGMGGASSNAASALLAVREACRIDRPVGELHPIAAELGSDVPFFLGADFHGEHESHAVDEASTDEQVSPKWSAAQAGGRGERITPVDLAKPLHFVVVYPGIVLSTAEVYGEAQIPGSAVEPSALLDALRNGRVSQVGQSLTNRLTTPALKIAPQIREIHESMWQLGMKAVQLTGSGSASFALVESRSVAEAAADRLRKRLQPGALVMAATTPPTHLAPLS